MPLELRYDRTAKKSTIRQIEPDLLKVQNELFIAAESLKLISDLSYSADNPNSTARHGSYGALIELVSSAIQQSAERTQDISGIIESSS